MNAEEYIQSKINDGTLNTSSYFTNFVKDTVNGTLSGMDGFLNQVNTYYDAQTNPSNPNSFLFSKKEENYNDLKKTTYYNIKQIYERLSGLSKKSVDSLDTINIKRLNEIENIELNDLDMFYNFKFDQSDCLGENDKNKFDLYQVFQIIDRGNNDIGTKTLADLTMLYESLYTNFSSDVAIKDSLNPLSNNPFSKILSTSVNTIFSSLASSGGFNFYQIPNYLNLSSVLANSNNDDDVAEMVDHLFGVHTDTGLFGDFKDNKATSTFYGGLSGFPGYIFQIGASPTKLSGYSFEQKIKNNFDSSFCLDLVTDKNGNIAVTNEDVPDDIKKSNVTSFIVDFGKKNQQMFNSIELDSAQFAFTENSITTWVDFVNKSNNTVNTTNMFPIYEKYMYTCKVSGMGNATIQPLTYFYLRNTPMFYGTYWITNVQHNISPNNMTTTFQGVRQPIATKNDTRRLLLDLYQKAAAKLSGDTQSLNTVVTEGIVPTSGIIKKNVDTDKPFKELIQKNQNQSGNSIFDGKALLGCYVYSITQTNNRTAANVGILTSLYNSAKAYINTESHTDIIASMTNIAVANMSILCQNGDTRYDDGSKGVSLYKLFKVTGNGYSSNSPLNDLLDEVSKSVDSYKTAITVGKDNNVYSIKITPEPKEPGHKEYQLSVAEQIGTADEFSFGDITMFIDNNTEKKYLDDKYSALGRFTIYNVLSGHTILGKAESAKYQFLTDGTPSEPTNNNFPWTEIVNKNNNTKTTPISIKFMGGFNDGLAFFSTMIEGKVGINIQSYEAYYQACNLTRATNLDLTDVVKPTNNYGSLKNNYTANVVIKLVDEYNKWNFGNTVLKDSDCGNDKVLNLLDTYWAASPGGLQYYKSNGGCNGKINPESKQYEQVPWSATFISYIMKNSGVKEFPYSSKHATYIQKARNNTNNGGSYSWYGYEVTNPSARVEIGDLLCYTRNPNENVKWNEIKDDTNTHCDCVTNINRSNPSAPVAEVIGGNISNTVRKSNVILQSDDKINLSGDQSKYKGILKYIPKEVVSDINIKYTVSKTAEAAYDKAEGEEPGFKAKVQSVASQIGAKEMDLVQIMFKETAGTLSPAKWNNIPFGNQQKGCENCGCVGLIQFCPDTGDVINKTIAGKKYNLQQLSKMTRVQQMDVVLEYFKAQGFSTNKSRTIADLYCATFYPYAVGKPGDFIIGSEKTKSPNYKFKVAQDNGRIAVASNLKIEGKPVCTVDGVVKFVTT
jgi:hypothetical protein